MRVAVFDAGRVMRPATLAESKKETLRRRDRGRRLSIPPERPVDDAAGRSVAEEGDARERLGRK
jgi:hypothetical protein